MKNKKFIRLVRNYNQQKKWRKSQKEFDFLQKLAPPKVDDETKMSFQKIKKAMENGAMEVGKTAHEYVMPPVTVSHMMGIFGFTLAHSSELIIFFSFIMFRFLYNKKFMHFYFTVLIALLLACR